MPAPLHWGRCMYACIRISGYSGGSLNSRQDHPRSPVTWCPAVPCLRLLDQEHSCSWSHFLSPHLLAVPQFSPWVAFLPTCYELESETPSYSQKCQGGVRVRGLSPHSTKKSSWFGDLSLSAPFIRVSPTLRTPHTAPYCTFLVRSCKDGFSQTSAVVCIMAAAAAATRVLAIYYS